MPDAQSSSCSTPSPTVALLLRIGWMFAANAVLFFGAVFIFKNRETNFSWVDLVFGAALVAALLARYADIRWFGGQTADGNPATMAHWRRYAFLVLSAGLVIWGAAHLAAFLVGR